MCWPTPHVFAVTGPDLAGPEQVSNSGGTHAGLSGSAAGRGPASLVEKGSGGRRQAEHEQHTEPPPGYDQEAA
jgi:hypothetical protein